jgi:hypothetical protein
MGYSLKYILVSDNKVFDIPNSKNSEEKITISELSNQYVLIMEMIYENKNRKPYKIIRIIYNRMQFDQEGVYTRDYLSEENRVKLEYVMYPINTQIGEKQSLPIPKAPVTPSKGEIEIIKQYLNKKYPPLLINSPNAVENAVKQSEEKHESDLRKFKDSHR